MELLDDLTAADVSRWLLAVFFTFVAVFYTIRILALSRRTGTRLSTPDYREAGTVCTTPSSVSFVPQF